MAENSREAELKITADASGVRSGVEQAKTALGDLSRSAEREGAKAGAGIEKAGDGADKAAAKIERETRNMIGSIERATAAFQAGERGSSGYFEALAKQRGVSGDALKPYLDQLRQAEAAQKAATGSLGAMGVSAAQTAAALRQVPAQFTDIATSLASGQAPLTVFLQQGGQLKDAFGGAGAAARALGGYVLGLINPFTLAAAAVGGLGFAYLKGASEAESFQKTLVLTGNVAGVTAQQLSAISASIAGSGVTQGAAADALNQLAATGKVGAENLGRFAAAAVQLERVGGPAVEETVKAFAELGKAPLQAALKLNESTNFLTVSLYDQIKALEGQGRATEAARVAQEAFASAAEQRIPALAQNLGALEKAWNGIKGAIKGVADELLNIGRADTIGSLEASLKAAQSRAARLNGGGILDNFFRDQALASAAGYQQQIDALKEVDRLARKVADADAQRLKTIQAREQFDKIAEQSLDKQAKLALEIQRIENLGLAAGKSRKEIEEQIAAAKERARDKGSDSAAQRALQQEAALLERLAGLSGTYQQGLNELQAARKRDVITEQQYVEKVKELIASQPFAVKLAKEQADAEKQVADAMARGNDLYLKKIEALNQSADAVGKQVQRLQDEEAALALSQASNVSLAEAIELVTIKRLEEQQVAAKGDQPTIDAIQREIDKRRELAQLIGNKEARDAAKKGAEAAAKEWERASNEIERTITDALMRGFESGKGFIQTLRDTLVNTFKTLVLRPTIQALVQPLAVGLLGTGAGAAAAGTAGALNAASGVGAAGGLLGLFGAGGLSGALMGGAGWLTGATTLGGSLGAAGSLIGTGTVAGATSGLAMGLGAIAPIAGAAALVANALGLLRSTEYKGTSIRGTLGTGDLSDFAVTRKSGSLFGGPKWSENFAGTNAASDAIQAAFSSVREATAAMAEQLGISGTAIRQFTQALYIDGNGKTADQVQKELSDALNSANDSLARFALGTTAYSKAGESAAQTLERLAGSLTGVNGVLGALGQSLLTVGVAGGDTASQLLGLFGGLQQFQQAGAQYLDAYYTEAEKTAIATQQLTAQLSGVGLAVPATREAYRALVEAQDLNTESGRKAYAALLQLSPAFAAIVPATEALADASTGTAAAVQRAAEQMAEAGRRALAGLAEQQGELQVELLRAQGQAAAAAELERSNALAKLTDGLSATDAAAATAAFDFNAALRQQIDALNAAKSAAEQAAQAQQAAAQAEAQRVAAIANERAGLEQRLLQQQGDTAGLRALELQSLDASNRAILERIYLLQDQQAAEQEAARVAQESARVAQEAARAEEQRLAAIAQERGGLEERLLQLQGDTTALRARELATLDPANRAILERIYAIQDEQTATAAAAQAARDLEAAQQAAAQAEAQRVQAIANEREGLVTRLLQAEGNTAELRARELAGLDASNRAILERIFAIEDEKIAQQAAAEASRAAAEASAEAARQAEQLRQAWQSVSDGIFGEVARIRGLSGAGPQSLAAAQSRFAITTAQARAGDQEAARMLPELSRTLLQLAEASATSLLDVERIRAQVAASLEATGSGLASRFGLTVPKLATGTNYVPRDMVAMVHEGEAIVPRRFNPAAGGGDSGASAAVVEVLRELLDAVKAGDLSVVRLQTEANRLLKKWDGEGLPEERFTS